MLDVFIPLKNMHYYWNMHHLRPTDSLHI